MFLELESVFNTPGLSEPFAFRLPESYDALPFAQPPEISGQAKNRAGVVTLEGTAHIRLRASCDRCAARFDYAADTPFNHTLVLSLNEGDSGDLILLDGFRFSPDDLIWEDIVLSLPPKTLCQPGCKGLCPRCGKNLNEGPCACAPEGDPRLAALRQLLDHS